MVFTRDAPTEVVDHLPPKPKRRIGYILAAAFLVFVAGIAVAGSIKSWLTDDVVPTPAIASAPVAVGEIAPVIPDTGACSAFPATDPAADQLSPPPTTWSQDGGTSRPSNIDVGPAFSGPVSWCYSHSPTGALFSAANYIAQMQTVGMTPVDEITLARFGASDTPGRELLIQRFAAVGTGEVTLPATNGSRVAPAQFVAYRFVDYSAEQASIEIINAWNDSLTLIEYHLQWESGDWKLVIPDSGQWERQEILLPLDTVRYTPWSAQAAG